VADATAADAPGNGPLAGSVAFITGAARGQGRSHAVTLAAAGADIIAVDICAGIGSVPYPLGSTDDLEQTAREVTALGRRVVARQADVRDLDGLSDAFTAGVAELGAATVVVANAGIAPMAAEPDPAQWHDVIDVNLTGVYHTVEVALPAMIEHGAGGSVIMINSTAGLNGIGGPGPGSLGYTAAKHGGVGLMKAYANLLAPHGIRVNSVHPTGVDTPMVMNPVMQAFFRSEHGQSNATTNAMPVGLITAQDVSEAVLWLASDASRYVTGVALPVDAGYTNKR
jgi:SDR family mycofactocin-dependent oxidoreductase